MDNMIIREKRNVKHEQCFISKTYAVLPSNPVEITTGLNILKLLDYIVQRFTNFVVLIKLP